jgi:hypothetical protein
LPELHRRVVDWLRLEAIHELVRRDLIDQFRPSLK